MSAPTLRFKRRRIAPFALFKPSGPARLICNVNLLSSMVANPTLIGRIILSAIRLTWLMTCQAAIPPLPGVEQEVIEGFVADQTGPLGNRAGAVFETASAASVDFGGSYDKLQTVLNREASDRGPTFAQALENMVKKNSTGARIAGVTNSERPVRLVSETLFKSISSDSDASYDDWLLFYDRFPGCSRVVTLSRVGLDSEGTFAVLCYGLKEPYRPGTTSFEALRREGKRWVISEFRKAMGPKALDLVPVRCELRYYIAHFSPEGASQPLALQVVENRGTNLVCTVPRTFRLAKSSAECVHFAGWVLQVTEPTEYAGQLVTAVLYDYPASPFDVFRFGRRYDAAVPKNMIGDLNFRVRFW